MEGGKGQVAKTFKKVLLTIFIPPVTCFRQIQQRRVEEINKDKPSRLHINTSLFTIPLVHTLRYHYHYHLPTLSLIHLMAPKPASTAGKAPASTASKAPAKSSEGAKAAKKTAAAPVDGEKKKRKKVRKETYSSYIYKGEQNAYFIDGITHSSS